MTASMEDDLAALRQWWTAIAPTAPAELAGLWFGITELIVDGQPRTTLYVAGTERFEPDDPTADWAAEEYVWWSANRYISPGGLRAMSDRDPQAILDHAADLVRAVRPQDDVNVEGVAVGFDEGDFTILAPSP